MFKKLFRRNKPQTIIIVSGLPRSGTSMMMKMLDAGGISPLQDGIRSADDDNPKGYYEFERVKQLDKGDTEWLAAAGGKAVKVISALLLHLPPAYQYKVLFMRRNITEVLASQAKMLVNREQEQAVDDVKMQELYRKHLQQVFAWVARQENITVLDVDYGQMVGNPLAQIPKINTFLGGNLDTDAMKAMIDPTLYRNRVQANL